MRKHTIECPASGFCLVTRTPAEEVKNWSEGAPEAWHASRIGVSMVKTKVSGRHRYFVSAFDCDPERVPYATYTNWNGPYGLVEANEAFHQLVEVQKRSLGEAA